MFSGRHVADVLVREQVEGRVAEVQARFWDRRENGSAACRLCPHACVILPGKTGICGVRVNRDGVLYSDSYGRLSSIALDPIEKKPLFHVDPGGYLLSVGSYGCNLGCLFCQNWQISQERPHFRDVTPAEVVASAMAEREDRAPEWGSGGRGSNALATAKHMDDSGPNRQKSGGLRVTGIAYTYNEPTVFLEFVMDCAEKAKAKGLKNVLVTNGFISQEALREALPLVDAMNIDVKGWSEEFYRKVLKGRLAPVLRAVETAAEKTWVEVTYLVIPGHNDRDEDVRGVSRWLSGISPSIPLHLSRYFPNYKFDAPTTPFSTLERLRDIAREYLHYVYIGNAAKRGYADTTCSECGEKLLSRSGLELERSYLVDGACPKCGRKLELVGEVQS